VDLGPISLETSAGIVARFRRIAQKVWHVDIRLSPSFDALTDDVLAGRNRGNGEEADPNAKNDFEHDNACVVGDQFCSADNANVCDSARCGGQEESILPCTDSSPKSIASQ